MRLIVLFLINKNNKTRDKNRNIYYLGEICRITEICKRLKMSFLAKNLKGGK